MSSYSTWLYLFSCDHRRYLQFRQSHHGILALHGSVKEYPSVNMLFASLCFLVAAGLAHATVASNRQRPVGGYSPAQSETYVLTAIVDWNIGQPSKIHSVDYSKCLAFTNTTDEIMQVT